MVEFWRAGGVETGASFDLPRKVEAEGWDGQMFMDSQCLTADPYARMAVWAVATERLKLCTGVTNSATRHVAVTAAAAATIQSISNGRAVLGIGRGDSALAYLGYAPDRLAAFHSTLKNLQTLLSGDSLEFGAEKMTLDAPGLETMSLGGRPEKSSLKWLPKDLPKVPLDVAATGPKVIEMAAPIAEQVTLSVGAIPARLKWGMELGNAARRTAGLSEKGCSYGAQIIVACYRDHNEALRTSNAMVPPLARFQVIQGKVAGPITNSDAVNFERIKNGYDMTKHGDPHANDKVIGDSLDPEFLERFAIIGTPERCIERLLELNKLGIDRFVIVGPGFYREPHGGNLFAEEVIPAVRAATK
jgi:5,10-methylenetetrahydromethanopterin reductase